MLDEFQLTTSQLNTLAKFRADMIIQAMLFDMNIDWETLSLVPKNNHKEEAWLTHWKDKRDNSDNLAESPEQAGW